MCVRESERVCVCVCVCVYTASAAWPCQVSVTLDAQDMGEAAGADDMANSC